MFDIFVVKIKFNFNHTMPLTQESAIFLLSWSKRKQNKLRANSKTKNSLAILWVTWRHLLRASVTRVLIRSPLDVVARRVKARHIYGQKNTIFLQTEWVLNDSVNLRDLTNLYADLRRDIWEETMCFFARADRFVIYLLGWGVYL